ncbi:MAG TPA: aminopeptidase [Planctomycetota bacterium]|nr:aminopeptidase [Planctomycetota bacterium]
MRRLVRAALVLACGVAPALSSCTGCYYMRVGFGQAKVLLGREPIDDVLASGRLDPDEQAKLALVPKVRAFAQDSLGLVKNGSYTKFYDTGTRPVSWNVSACEATAFRPYEWSFPFVGAAPYKGFFDLDQAKDEAARLREAGYDVQVSEVGAYSTLGWFDDPVFRRMLSRDVYDLSNMIVHELTHATVFKSGDVSFNESVATFVGNEGALAFLAHQFGPRSRELEGARDAIADEAVFAGFIDSLYARLDALYGGPGSAAAKRAGREEVFAEAKAEFEAIRVKRMREPEAWTWFAKRKLDNAMILAFKRYHTDLDVYRDVLTLCGGDFKEALAIYREAAESDDPRAALGQWRTWAARNPPAQGGGRYGGKERQQGGGA